MTMIFLHPKTAGLPYRHIDSLQYTVLTWKATSPGPYATLSQCQPEPFTPRIFVKKCIVSFSPVLKSARGRLNIKMSPYQYRVPRVEDKTVSRQSYL